MIVDKQALWAFLEKKKETRSRIRRPDFESTSPSAKLNFFLFFSILLSFFHVNLMFWVSWAFPLHETQRFVAAPHNASSNTGPHEDCSIAAICRQNNKTRYFREFVRHLGYNTEEKHHFVPFEILKNLFQWAQHEYDNPQDFHDAPFTAAQRYSNKQSTAHGPTTNQLCENLGPLIHILLNKKNSVVKRA